MKVITSNKTLENYEMKLLKKLLQIFSSKIKFAFNSDL